MAICAANLSHQMNRQGSQYTTSYHPITSSTSYNRTSRSTLPATNGNATSLIKAINSGSMNISTTNNHRTRPPSRFSQASSPERTIRINGTTTQRRVPSQDRSVSFELNKNNFF